MSQQQSQASRVIRLQNSFDFELDNSKLSIIFKKGLFEKILNPPQENKDIPRTVTVKCLQKGCR
jgi:hypothetical protein